MARKLSRPPTRTRNTASPQRTAAAAARPRRDLQEEKVTNFFLGLILFALAVVVFYPAFSAGFIWDDDQLLTVNPQVHAANGWWTLWFKPETADYFPLTSTTLWLEYHLGQIWNLWSVPFLQGHPTGDYWSGYHIMNVMFHATATVLTWQTLKRLRVPGAWLAAAIFAVHPVCVESVAWISERKNTISQIFFLLSIIYYVRFEEKNQWWRYVVAVVCFILSLLAKTSVVMLPFMLLILAWWRKPSLELLRTDYTLEKNPIELNILHWSFAVGGALAGGGLFTLIWMHFSASAPSLLLVLAVALLGGGSGYALGTVASRVKKWESFAGFELIWILPYFLVAAILGAVTVYFQYGRAIGGEEIPIGNYLQRACSACFATGFYLYSALWPFNLIEIYPQWHRAFWERVTEPTLHWQPPAPESLPYWVQAIPGLIIGGFLVFCWLQRRKTWARAILVGLGCYVVAMLPALGMLYMSYMRLTLVADHFQYISIAAVIALVVAAGFTRNLKPIYLVIASVFFAVVAYLNWNQIDNNASPINSEIAEFIWIGGPLVLAGAALVKEFWLPVWYTFLALVLTFFSILTWYQAGIYLSEKTLWSATLAKNPYSWQAHNHLGAALYMEGKWREAAPHFLRATQLKPENPESHNNLGLTDSMAGRMDDAIHEYETAVGIKDDSAMRTNLANAYEQTGQFDKAIENYHQALKMNPGNASAHCNLGYALMRQGRVDEAIPEFEATIEMDPGMQQGRNDLIEALRYKGVNLNAPDLNANYGFDLRKAIELLVRTQPPPPQQRRMMPPQ